MINKMIRCMIPLLRKARILILPFIKTVNRLLRKLVSLSHALQMKIEWGVPPNPEWFDHYLDLYYVWSTYRNPLWIERGIFSLLALKGGG